MKALIASTAFSIALCLALPCSGELLEEGGIGITCDPDSVAEYLPGRGCPSPSPAEDEADYRKYDVAEFNEWIALDVNLLIDLKFDGVDVDTISDHEARNLLLALNYEEDNRFTDLGWDVTDLGMTIRYAHASETPYDPMDPVQHFQLYEYCASESLVPASEFNHIDVYLSATYTYATVGIRIRDPNEDGPDSTWTSNCVLVTDGSGNAFLGDPEEELWPRHSAQQVCHELTHMIWNSNTSSHDVQYREAPNFRPPDYNELFACSSEYLVIPAPSSAAKNWDSRYAYSLLNDLGTVCVDPPAYMDNEDRNMQRYHLWKLFGAYLGYRFRDPVIENTLLSRWARNRTVRFPHDPPAMERTFCGLALLLDDFEYRPLGNGPPWGGAYRTSKVFADYGIARYVDDNGYDEAYWFGPDYSPCRDQRQFRKIDTNPLAYWELAIPPDFVLDADNVGQWVAYPDTSDTACPTGWYDHEHGEAFGHTCVPIKVDLWGSNYLAFRADISHFTASWDDTLIVEFDWTDKMDPNVQLWLSVLTYSTAEDSLFLRGDKLTSVSTQTYRSDDPGVVTVEVPDFRENDNEAVVIVMTVTDYSYSLGHDDTYECLRRLDYDAPPTVDLEYSYRFEVVGHENPPSGCPFVSALRSDGYTSDNNVLASTSVKGADMLDAYVLEHPPEDLDGEYRLRLSEDESDYTRFDRIELLAVDHKPGLAAAVLSDGTFGSYAIRSAPVACRNAEGEDLLKEVSAEDGLTAFVAGGSWVDVFYPASALPRGGGGGGGVVASGSPKNPLPPRGGGRARATPGVLNVTELSYRENLHTRILELPEDVPVEDDLLRMRVTTNNDIVIDQLFLADLVDEPLFIQRCPLSIASHSELEDCLTDLVADNDVYVSLAPGEKIDIFFAVPDGSPELERDFVLVTEGQFEADRDDGDAAAEGPGETSREIAIYPNPFTSSTSISYHVPTSGAAATVRLYDAAGRLVKTLAEGAMPAGTHVLTWDGTDESGRRVAAGVYFCKVDVLGHDARKKLILLQ